MTNTVSIHKEIGQIKKIKFLDKVENHWASKKNPHRIGYFIKKVDAGIHLTDGNGDFWTVRNDADAQSEIVGSYKEDILTNKPT